MYRVEKWGVDRNCTMGQKGDIITTIFYRKEVSIMDLVEFLIKNSDSILWIGGSSIVAVVLIAGKAFGIFRCDCNDPNCHDLTAEAVEIEYE